jgi:tripartite-type tricarboxylate transporter receptor subunit TctC
VAAPLPAERTTEALNRICVMENRSGANGAIGAEHVMRAAPNGETLLHSIQVHIVLKFVQRGVPFGWTRMCGPKGLPADKVDEVCAAAQAALRDPEVVRWLGEHGCAPIIGDPAEFTGRLVAESAGNAAIAQAAGIRHE